MVIYIEKENNLQNFQNLPDNQFRREFLEQSKIFRNKVKTQLDDENLKLDSKFVRAIYHFLETHISKVNIRMCPKDVDNNIIKEKDKYIELKSYGVKQITLDPGKYHPKYDILYKRNPVVFFGTKGLIKKKGDNLENKKNENERYKKLNKNNSMDDININVISDKNKNKMDLFNIKNLKKKKLGKKVVI